METTPGQKGNSIMSIIYKRGDMFADLQREDCIIHCCNNIGKWGSGFVVPLGKMFPDAKKAYHYWFNGIGVRPSTVDKTTNPDPVLGHIQIVRCNPDPQCFCPVSSFIEVVNMIGQNGIISKDNPHPIDYNAINECLQRVKKYIDREHRIIAPKFGSGLAGGSWEKIEGIINHQFTDRDITIYTLD